MSLRTRLLLALAGTGLALLLGSVVAREVAIWYATEALIQSYIETRLASMDRETCEARRDLERRDFRPRGPGDEPERGFGRGPDRGPNGPPPGFRPEGPPPDGGFGPAPQIGGPGPAGGTPGPPPLGGPERGREPFPGRFDRPFGGGGPRMARVFFYDPDFNPRVPYAPPFPEAAKAKLRSGETFVRDRYADGFFGALATSWHGGVCSYALAVMQAPPPFASVTWLIAGAFALIFAPAVVLWIALTNPVARIRALAADVRTAASRHYETSVPVTGRDEIAELGHAFNEASAVVRAHVKEVEQRERALRDFVAHTTHDVALPLSVLLSHVARLRDATAGEGTKEAVTAIAQETQYIASLLANLDAVSRLETEAALHEKNPVDLTALVERVAVRHRGVAASSGVEFNHSAPPSKVMVTGDVTLIEQAVNNLVHNAIQYNHCLLYTSPSPRD